MDPQFLAPLIPIVAIIAVAAVKIARLRATRPESPSLRGWRHLKVTSRASNRSKQKYRNGSISQSVYSARHGRSGGLAARDTPLTAQPEAVR
jgi:hypothetical protein